MKHFLLPITCLVWFLLVNYSIDFTIAGIIFLHSFSWLWLILLGIVFIGIIKWLFGVLPQLIFKSTLQNWNNREHTYRGDLQTLLMSILHDILVTIEPLMPKSITHFSPYYWKKRSKLTTYSGVN